MPTTRKVRAVDLDAVVVSFNGLDEQLLDLKFTYDNESLVLGAKSGVYFANEGSSGYKITAATGWSTELAEKEPGLCIGFIKSDVFVGAASGKLLQFKDLLEKMLVLDHEKRIHPSAALKHDFITAPFQ